MRPRADVFRARAEHLGHPLYVSPPRSSPSRARWSSLRAIGDAPGSALLAGAALVRLRLALCLLEELIESQLGDVALEHGLADELDDARRLLPLLLQGLLDLLGLGGGNLEIRIESKAGNSSNLLRDQGTPPVRSPLEETVSWPRAATACRTCTATSGSARRRRSGQVHGVRL
jgi:hypothetical protein